MHDHDTPARTPGTRSPVIRLPAPATVIPPRVTAAQVITRRRTPALATWRAAPPPPRHGPRPRARATAAAS